MPVCEKEWMSKGCRNKASHLPQSTLMHTSAHRPCLLPRAPMASVAQMAEPHTFPSVGEGREDEEAVFFFADPAHELMDGTDG